jgi:hypothetical protein
MSIKELLIKLNEENTNISIQKLPSFASLFQETQKQNEKAQCVQYSSSKTEVYESFGLSFYPFHEKIFLEQDFYFGTNHLLQKEKLFQRENVLFLYHKYVEHLLNKEYGNIKSNIHSNFLRRSKFLIKNRDGKIANIVVSSLDII